MVLRAAGEQQQGGRCQADHRGASIAFVLLLIGFNRG
jgi:hypothetical protein